MKNDERQRDRQKERKKERKRNCVRDRKSGKCDKDRKDELER